MAALVRPAAAIPVEILTMALLLADACGLLSFRHRRYSAVKEY